VSILFVIINLSFAVFNLIPIPPLDGSKLLYPFLPQSLIKYTFKLERYGFIILLALIYLGVIGQIMSPLVWLLYKAVMGPWAL
jgi:Zn-dependent protease